MKTSGVFSAKRKETSAARWARFNGKRVDVPFLVGRSLKHGLEPTSRGLLSTHKDRSDRDADPSNLMDRTFISLDDLCAHLELERTKGDVAGSMVAPAIEARRTDCERDAIHPLTCTRRVLAVLSAPR